MIHRLQKNRMMVVIGILLFIMFSWTIYWFYISAKQVTDSLITQQVEQLAKILNEINDTCKIITIKHDKNYIDFLNIKSFVGSEVGPLNLAYPDQWKGPYLNENLSIQGKSYELVKAHGGYYVVPGEGVKLSNGKIIGKDIMFDSNTDIEQYINEQGGLEYENRPLAIPVFRDKQSLKDVAQNELLDVDDDNL